MGTAVDWRRDLHAHPEVGFTEFRTASRVANRSPSKLPHNRRPGVSRVADSVGGFFGIPNASKPRVREASASSAVNRRIRRAGR